MWNKEQNPSTGAHPPATPQSRQAAPQSEPRHGAIIGGSMRIKGEIYSSEELHLDGEVEGRLELESRLTIGPGGKADADIKAPEVVVAGNVHGNVEATHRLVLRSGANLVGDVKTSGIVIEDGAYFKGGIDITRPEPTREAAKSAGR